MISRTLVSTLIPLLLLHTATAMAVDLPAVLQFERVVELSLPVSGVISKVHAEEGQSVNEGDLLLELEDIPFKVTMEKTAAELRLLEAERLSIEKELIRNKELFDRMVLPTVSLENIEAAFVLPSTRNTSWSAS